MQQLVGTHEVDGAEAPRLFATGPAGAASAIACPSVNHGGGVADTLRYGLGAGGHPIAT